MRGAGSVYGIWTLLLFVCLLLFFVCLLLLFLFVFLLFFVFVFVFSCFFFFFFFFSYRHILCHMMMHFSAYRNVKNFYTGNVATI